MLVSFVVPAKFAFRKVESTELLKVCTSPLSLSCCCASHCVMKAKLEAGENCFKGKTVTLCCESYFT